jgi:hypothetical protein
MKVKINKEIPWRFNARFNKKLYYAVVEYQSKHSEMSYNFILNRALEFGMKRLFDIDLEIEGRER